MEAEPRLRVAVYDFALPLFAEQRAAAYAFASGEVGSGYDYAGVARFISRRRGPSDARWFCSEFVAATCATVGRFLFHETEPHEVPPGLLPRSLALRYVAELPAYLARL